MARQASDDPWLKKERFTAYLDLIEQLSMMLQQFVVGMKVSKFDQHTENSGHDDATFTWEWHQQMDELERAEVRAKILGGHPGALYGSSAENLIGEMLDAIDDDDVTKEQWDALSGRGHDLRRALVKSAMADFEVPAIGRRRKLLARVG